jgi:hypothetical protein
MLRIFSTHRLFGFLLIGLMITSCGGGTSSNTPSTGTSSKTSDGGGGTSSNTSDGGGGTNSGGGGTTPQTLTVTVPLLGRSYTITKGKTTRDEIDSIAASDRISCDTTWGPVFPDPPSAFFRACTSQVNSAAQEARNFINS